MDQVSPSPATGDVTLMVKEKERTLQITTSLERTVDEFSVALLAELGGEAVGQRVRLIASGKMLKAGDTLASYGLKDGAFVLCVLSTAPPPAPKPVRPVRSAALDAVNDLVRDLRLGDEGHRDRDRNGGEEDDGEPPRRGFDRLVEWGLSDEEIVAMRAHFYPRVLEYSAEQPDVEGEDAEARVYRMEAEWIMVQGPDSEFAANTHMGGGVGAAVRQLPQAGGYPGGGDEDDLERLEGMGGYDGWGGERADGSQAEFLWGMAMGVLLGPIMLFWLWERTVSRRQRLGIATGVFCNIFMSLFQRWMYPNAAKPRTKGNLRGQPGVAKPAVAKMNVTFAILPPGVIAIPAKT